MKEIVFTAPAARQFAKLPVRVQKTIAGKLRRYAETGAGDVKTLVGTAASRLRVGDYRVVFVESKATIDVQAVANRRDIYR